MCLIRNQGLYFLSSILTQPIFEASCYYNLYKMALWIRVTPDKHSYCMGKFQLGTNNCTWPLGNLFHVPSEGGNAVLIKML